jgi:glycosyltransferase involved in cell wall biosynthesis
MKVTIVVRTFNRPTYLREALTSLALQSHTDWELLFFDDAASESNLKIFKEFKSHHSDKRMIYMSSDTPYDMFQQSWLISPDLANGEIMIRLDDDDILAENCLSFLSDVYEKNTELDFSYGSCATFNENGLYQVVQTMNPFEAP